MPQNPVNLSTVIEKFNMLNKLDQILEYLSYLLPDFQRFLALQGGSRSCCVIGDPPFSVKYFHMPLLQGILQKEIKRVHRW